MMPITKDKTREIIESFEEEIWERKQPGPKPQKWVINFRNERRDGIEREVFNIPLDYLRYRKDNGRISSDVISYETTHQKLDETTKETQEILFLFLKEKDEEKTDILKKAIKKEGQTEPAIITCDGFLINGNRRKMVLEELRIEDQEKFGTMKVVILPKPGEPGGPPTIKEIELLENRYQLQQEGKSEYYGLDRALSIRRKEEVGITIEDQLRDDPSLADLDDKDFRKEVEECRKNYLLPLNRADMYLRQIGRENYYQSISSGYSDREGRWQAFVDYSKFYNGKLSDPKWQLESKISEDDVGEIQDIAFKIIRKRTIEGRTEKLHAIMRDLKKLLVNQKAKESLYALSENVTHELGDSERIDKYGNEYEPKQQDLIWSQKYNQIFAAKVNAAYNYLQKQEETETPLALLEGAYNKLIHKNLVIKNILHDDQITFCKLAEKIRDKADSLKTEVWDLYKKS